MSKKYNIAKINWNSNTNFNKLTYLCILRMDASHNVGDFFNLPGTHHQSLTDQVNA